MASAAGDVPAHMAEMMTINRVAVILLTGRKFRLRTPDPVS